MKELILKILKSKLLFAVVINLLISEAQILNLFFVSASQSMALAPSLTRDSFSNPAASIRFCRQN